MPDLFRRSQSVTDLRHHSLDFILCGCAVNWILCSSSVLNLIYLNNRWNGIKTSSQIRFNQIWVLFSLDSQWDYKWMIEHIRCWSAVPLLWPQYQCKWRRNGLFCLNLCSLFTISPAFVQQMFGFKASVSSVLCLIHFTVYQCWSELAVCQTGKCFQRDIYS